MLVEFVLHVTLLIDNSLNSPRKDIMLDIPELSKTVNGILEPTNIRVMFDMKRTLVDFGDEANDAIDTIESIYKVSPNEDMVIVLTKRSLTTRVGILEGLSNVASIGENNAFGIVSWSVKTPRYLAHEILHIIGVVHDERSSVYLMSPNPDSSIMSPESIISARKILTSLASEKL